MKLIKLLIICFIAGLGVSQSAMAQKNALYLGVVGMDLRIGETSGLGPVLGFESQIREKATIGAQVALLYSNTNLVRTIPGDWNLKETILLVQPGIKFYTKEAFKGLNLGLRGNYLRYDQLLIERITGGETAVSIKDLNPSFLGAGLNLGYSTSVLGRFNFSISSNGDIFFDVNSRMESTISLGLDAKVGYRF
jgi:hypothetical protein